MGKIVKTARFKNKLSLLDPKGSSTIKPGKEKPF